MPGSQVRRLLLVDDVCLHRQFNIQFQLYAK
jgi:hypothetical protein